MRSFFTKSKQLNFYSCGNLMSRDSFLHQRRTMNCNVLIFVLDGTLKITQSEHQHNVSQGEYIFLKAGKEHYGYAPSSERLSYLWVHFSAESPFEPLDDTAAEPKDYAYYFAEHSAAASAVRVNMLFNQLIDYSRNDLLYTDEILKSALSLLLMEITQQYIDFMANRAEKISPAVYSIAEWIKSNCHKNITLHDIAEEFHYNCEYLSALFKREMGVTIVNYLNKSRVAVSKNLLSNNSVTIKEAAFSSGFNDEKYFMRVFKKNEGITPMQYKNAFCKKNINAQ